MSLTVKRVPVDGFWSITVYNPKGYYEAPENAISVNNVTAKRDADRAVTVHFGGDPAQLPMISRRLCKAFSALPLLHKITRSSA